MKQDISKKAIILDLDNTIYSVPQFGEWMFSSLFNKIKESRTYSGDLEELKDAIMRRPFQQVAEPFGLNEQLVKECIDLLRQLTIDGPLATFPDYKFVARLQQTKYLVTAGFTTLQQSKIDQLSIRDDFASIYIVDPDQTAKSKKDCFLEIMHEYKYKVEDLLVVGDDPHSEIKAAAELNIDAVLYAPEGKRPDRTNVPLIHSFRQLKDFV